MTIREAWLKQLLGSNRMHVNLSQDRFFDGPPATPPTTPPTTETPPTDPGQPADPAAPTDPQGRVLMIPQRAMRDIKERERDAGRKKALDELDAKCKTAGFGSFDEVLSSVTQLRQQPQTPQQNQHHSQRQQPRQPQRQQQPRQPQQQRQQQPPPPPPPTQPDDIDDDPDTDLPAPPVMPRNRGDRRAMARYQQDLDNYQRQVDAANKRAQAENRRRRRAERDRDAVETRAHLERTAMGVGIHPDHVDFAVHRLERHLQTLPEAQRTQDALKAFDEKKYFSEMRENFPYVFTGGQQPQPEITPVPVTTGATPNGNAQPPKPPRATQNVADGERVDCTKMSAQEFAAYKQKLGLEQTVPTPDRV